MHTYWIRSAVASTTGGDGCSYCQSSGQAPLCICKCLLDIGSRLWRHRRRTRPRAQSCPAARVRPAVGDKGTNCTPGPAPRYRRDDKRATRRRPAWERERGKKQKDLTLCVVPLRSGRSGEAEGRMSEMTQRFNQ